MGRRGKSIGAAAKKSRRHLVGMQAKRSSSTPVVRGECLSLPVDNNLTYVEAADLPSAGDEASELCEPFGVGAQLDCGVFITAE